MVPITVLSSLPLEDLLLYPKYEGICFPPVPVDGDIESSSKIVNLNTRMRQHLQPATLNSSRGMQVRNQIYSASFLNATMTCSLVLQQDPRSYSVYWCWVWRRRSVLDTSIEYVIGFHGSPCISCNCWRSNNSAQFLNFKTNLTPLYHLLISIRGWLASP